MYGYSSDLSKKEHAGSGAWSAFKVCAALQLLLSRKKITHPYHIRAGIGNLLLSIGNRALTRDEELACLCLLPF